MLTKEKLSMQLLVSKQDNTCEIISLVTYTSEEQIP